MRLLIFFFLLFPLLNTAQLFNKTNRFTAADTLRGSITPERAWWNVVYYDLSITPLFSNFSVLGTNTIHFTITGKPASNLQIDLQEPMIIDHALIDGTQVSFSRKGNTYLIKTPLGFLKKSFKHSAIHQLTLLFHGIPKPALQPPWDGGVVWSKDKLGNPWIGTACQGLGASSWWPCKDHQSDKADSATIRVTIPDTLMNVSNGRLVAVTTHANRTKTWSWHVRHPISAYNLTMNVGKYTHWEDTLNGKDGVLTLDYYVLEYESEKAKKQFSQTKPMLHIYESWLGSYPFYKDGFKLIQTSYLGMEHQSAIAYGNDFSNGYKGKDLSETGQGLKWDFILIHETAHEWFGNSITAKDIADLWVHEAFTTYAEYLYMETHFDALTANEYLIGIRKKILNDQPIIGPYNVNREGSSDMYFKGSQLIHIIRKTINNDSIFRKLLMKLNEQFKYSTTDSKSIERTIGSYTGIDFSNIFDQYLRTIQIPVLEYRTEKKSDKVRLLYRWSNCLPSFDLKIKVPDGMQSFQWVQPDTDWKMIETQFDKPDDIFPLFDQEFYIVYKKVMQ
ncbi:MAG: M1 family metallopeptidase [Bacteroidetes bacterium]|nr:M1 family metallopeptidase [Bacteroidota bacterium]